jgi:speckle-type POZ protein
MKIHNNSSSSCDGSITNQEKCSELDFSEQTWKEDFILIVEGKKLYVSKAILAFASPVFDRMFQSEFREKDQTELNLPGKKMREMQDFLRFIYPCMDECISDENVYKLLPLAEEYQVTTLISKCERFLISRLNKELTADDTKMMLQTAVIYNMEDLLVKMCEKLPEQSARAVISENILLPSKIFSKIMDELLGRLEQKTWYEGIYNYL